MFQSKVNAAIHHLAQHGKGGVLHAEDNINLGDQGVKSVLDILRSKHPNATPARPEALMMSKADPPPVHPVVYDQITASCIRSAALRVKGAAGPSVLDAHCWRRLCTSSKAASNDICHSLALLAKRLCTTLVDPKGISPLLACRLIALDKCPGVRPIGVCETYRRIIPKVVLLITSRDF